MRGTIRFYLRKERPDKKGRCPIYLIITHNRKRACISTGERVLPDQWNVKDEQVKKHKSRVKINYHLEIIKSNAQEARRTLSQLNKLSAVAIKRKLENSSKDNFFTLSKEYLNDLEGGSHYTWKNSRVAFDKLKAYHGSEHLPFNLIDAEFLDQFQKHLSKKNKASTIHKNLANIRSVLDIAIRKGLIHDNPFESVHFSLVKKNRPSPKTKLSYEQIKAIEGLQLQKDTNIFHSRNAFILAFYFCGIRFGDLVTLKWENIRGGRLKYTMSKTGNNIDVKIPKDAELFLNHYSPKNTFILPFLNSLTPNQLKDATIVRKRIQSANAIVNSCLSDIAKLTELGEGISMHVARHSFAQYGTSKGISVYKMMMLLGHQNIKTTQQYLKTIDVKIVDETMDEIF